MNSWPGRSIETELNLKPASVERRARGVVGGGGGGGGGGEEVRGVTGKLTIYQRICLWFK